MNKTTVVDMLKEGTVSIKFKKEDGSLRTMKATLDVEGVEISANPTTGETLSVYDTEKSDWRAFRWDRLQEVNGESFTA